jgi:hypothetical protein
MTQFYFWYDTVYYGVKNYYEMKTATPSDNWVLDDGGRAFSGNVDVDFGVQFIKISSSGVETALSPTGILLFDTILASEGTDVVHTKDMLWNCDAQNLLATDALGINLYARLHTGPGSWYNIGPPDPFDIANAAALGWGSLNATQWLMHSQTRRLYLTIDRQTLCFYRWGNISAPRCYIDNISGNVAAAVSVPAGDGLTFAALLSLRKRYKHVRGYLPLQASWLRV